MNIRPWLAALMSHSSLYIAAQFWAEGQEVPQGAQAEEKAS